MDSDTSEIKTSTAVGSTVPAKTVTLPVIDESTLRHDLRGNFTTDISPNCPKAKDPKREDPCGLCKVLPGDINGKKQVQCESCGQIFASKEDAPKPTK